MSEFNTRIHVIGDRRNGVVIVTFDPFRVLTIKIETMQRYADMINRGRAGLLTVDDVFTMISRAMLALISDLSEGDMQGNVDPHQEAYQEIFKRGIRMSDAEFALSGFIDPELHYAHHDHTVGRRKAYTILHQVVDLMLDDSIQNPREVELVRETET